jgi:hypothetical protein
MNTHLQSVREGRMIGRKALLAGAALGVWGGIKCLAAVLNYGSIGSGFYFVEWQAIVGCLSLTASLLLVSQHRWGKSAGLLAVASIVIGNGYLLLSPNFSTSPIIPVLFAMVSGYLISRL